MNEQRVRAVLTQILDHPETWDQGRYHSACGTKHCVAGWAQVMYVGTDDPLGAPTDAKRELGLGHAQGSWLFDCERTLDDFREVLRTGVVPEYDGWVDDDYDDDEDDYEWEEWDDDE